MKVVFIGAGSGFGAKTVVDLFSFPELRECELVLVDVNQEHLPRILRLHAFQAASRINFLFARSSKRAASANVRDGRDFIKIQTQFSEKLDTVIGT